MQSCGVIACTLGVIALLAGCGQEDKTAPSQVLARVNDGEITVMQLNNLLRSAGPAAAQAETKQNALDFLVNQELLQQKAAELQLDREPDVMQAIEQAKRQILAAAALNKLMIKTNDPSELEVQKFYDANPALFAQHASYEFTMFNLPLASLPAEVKVAIEKSHSIAETRQGLQSVHQAFQEKSNHLLAEQLPIDLLQQISRMKVGDILVRPEGNSVILVQLGNVEASPLSLPDSKERIVNYLKQSAEQEARKNKLAELKRTAKISYLKRFAEQTSASAAAATAKGSPADTVNLGLKGF